MRFLRRILPEIDWGFVFAWRFAPAVLIILLALCLLLWLGGEKDGLNSAPGWGLSLMQGFVKLSDGKVFSAEAIELGLVRLQWATPARPPGLTKPFLQRFWQCGARREMKVK